MAAINCGGIPENLLQTELFGDEKGGFTGAVSARKGKLRPAEGGTVFLDEIGELPMQVQSALLHVLQEKKAEPVGEDKDVDIDVTIITATNVDLEKAVAASRFRQDLDYRLSVVVIRPPPLRERLEGIPVLAAYFLESMGMVKPAFPSRPKPWPRWSAIHGPETFLHSRTRFKRPL